MPELQKAPLPILGRPEEYDRAKRILNRGRHPTFIGRDLVGGHARNGGLIFFTVDGRDAAVSVINAKKSILLVLCVAPEFRGHGVGRKVIEYLRPNFARVVESAVPWFENLGYVGIGSWKTGVSLRTRVMVRSELRTLSGRLQNLKHDPNAPAGIIAEAIDHLSPTLGR